MMKKNILSSLWVVTILLSVNSCKKDNSIDSVKKAAVQNYSTIVYASYSDALSTAQTMKTAIDAFVANPSDITLQAAKDAWLAARLPYGQTEAYRFYAGPIDNSVDGPEGLLNSWPLDENFIDYTVDAPNAGIINDTLNYPVVSKELIESLNANGGETNVSCGYHAIEFLLWGQDLSATTAGQRPYTDYTTAPNAVRRGQYLKACAELLVGHLQFLVDAWSPNGNNYRSAFENGDVNTALANILQGAGSLAYGELAGQRMEVAYETMLQEDEHSCFSDNTTNDLRMNQLGVQNVFTGTYTRVDGSVISGTSIYDIINTVDASIASRTKSDAETATTNIYAIQSPFDQQILSSNPTGRATLHTAIDAVKAEGTDLSVVANKLGLTISID